MTDFFDTGYGAGEPARWRRRKYGWLTDAFFDSLLFMRGGARKLDRLARQATPSRILVCGVRVTTRSGDMERVVASYRSQRHHLQFSIVDIGQMGKFENINRALAAAGDLYQFDWLIITDDDVALPSEFIDRAIGLCEAVGAKIAQPSHRFRSYVTYDFSRRAMGSLVRQVQFVEIGPVTLLHRDVFGQVIPFPPLRWGYGIDLWWAELARDNDWVLAALDGLPLEHLRPVAAAYGRDAAIDEGRAFLEERGVKMSRTDAMDHGSVLVPWR